MPSTLSPRPRQALDPEITNKRLLADALRQEMKLRDESIQSLAQRLGTGRTAVRRILDGKNTSITLGTMSRAAAAMGLELVLTTRRMSPARLQQLAAQLPDAKPARAAELQEDIVAGFYGFSRSKRRA